MAEDKLKMQEKISCTMVRKRGVAETIVLKEAIIFVKEPKREKSTQS